MIEKKGYEIAKLEETKSDPEMIISHSLDSEIREKMISVIEKEAPIRETLLFKRIINSFGMQKVGSRILPVFISIIRSIDCQKIIENGENVYLMGNMDFFRPTPDSSIRYSYQIPYIEGANCILYIVENGNRSSYTKKELKKLFLNAFEYQKCGSKVEDLFKNSLKDQRIRISKNGRILKQS